MSLLGIAQRCRRLGDLSHCSDALKGCTGGLYLENRTFLLSLIPERVTQTHARQGCLMRGADPTPLMRRRFELAAGVCGISF